jgi:hypothetical protein
LVVRDDSAGRAAPSGDAGRQASRLLGGAPSPNDVRAVELARLKAVLGQLRTGLDHSSTSVAQLRRVTRRLPLEDRSQFDMAYAQVRACEVALRSSILAASSAAPAEARKAQAKVAEDYEAYARAVMVAEATAKASRAAALATTTAE